MPYDQVFNKYKKGALHSGSKSGPVVTNHKQATAIFMSEKGKAAAGDPEYQSQSAPAPAPMPSSVPSSHPIKMLKMPKKRFGG